MAKTYTILPKVLVEAKKLDVSEVELKKMAKLGARFTHPDANYRYNQFIMNITKDGVVTMIGVIPPTEAKYYNRRTYVERKAEKIVSKANIEYKDGRKR